MQPNPMLNTYQQQIDSTRQMAGAVFDGTGKLEQAMLDNARRACDEQMKFFQSLGAARDPQGVAALYSTFFAHVPQQLLKTQQELIRIATETRQELGKVMLQQVNALNANGEQAPSPTTADAANPMLGFYSMWDKAVRDTTSAANQWLRRTTESTENLIQNGTPRRRTSKTRRTH